MRLFEAIIQANHRALAGDQGAGLHPAEFADELPIIALTCVDPRLNAILPQVLGVPPEQFIWLRNAGNIITGPLSSTMRSLALACAVKGGREIAIIGHTDCQVGKTSTMELLDRLQSLGIERRLLPDNLNELFGVFASDRANVIKGAEIARLSPLIGPKVPVHGLMVDIETGKLEWLVNGYTVLDAAGSRVQEAISSVRQTADAFKNLPEFKAAELKFPEMKIGETVAKAEDWLKGKELKIGDSLMKGQDWLKEKTQRVEARVTGRTPAHPHAPPPPPPPPPKATGAPPIPPRIPTRKPRN
jgi:carbonic anhydrase